MAAISLIDQDIDFKSGSVFCDEPGEEEDVQDVDRVEVIALTREGKLKVLYYDEESVKVFNELSLAVSLKVLRAIEDKRYTLAVV